MNLSEALNEVAQRAGLTLTSDIANGEKVKTHLIRAFNLRYKDFNRRYSWPWLQKVGTLQTIVNYTTGTVQVTNGSRTVTGTNTTFTAAMEGRYFKLDRDTELYLIKDFVSTTELTLEDPYIGDSGSSLTYLIWNKYYNLPPDCDLNLQIYISKIPQRVFPLPRLEFNTRFPNAYLNGNPYFWSWYTVNRVNSRYSTGTVSTTLNSRTLTGSSTSFVGNVFPGGLITIGSNKYNVESVDSNTQITMFQNANVTVSGSTYTIDTQNRSQITFSATPDPVVNLELIYAKRTYDLVNDNDELEIWPAYQPIVINAVYGYALEKLTSEKALPWLTVYEAEVEKAWNTINEQFSSESFAIPLPSKITGYRSARYAR